jgi:glyoxylase-like metal-dependent hydrolase (beta-lactamase superfamily II)
MELRKIGPEVYACLQPDRGWGWSNSGFVSRGGGLIVDTFWDLPRTRKMIELYATVASEPASRVVNTHHNGDHCWGNQLVRSAEIIGHRLCAEAMTKDLRPAALHAMVRSPDLPPELEPFARDLREFDFSGIEVTPPTTRIDGDLEIDLDGTPARLLYVGPAHTAGDVVVHLPETGVLFGGDVLWRNCTPLGWEGTFSRWLAALDRIIGLRPDVIVPGHGPVCGIEGVEELKRYIEYVMTESRRFFDAGLPALEAARRIDLGPYASWTQPERLIFNVERAYRELRGDSWDTPVNGLELIRQTSELRRYWDTASGEA